MDNQMPAREQRVLAHWLKRRTFGEAGHSLLFCVGCLILGGLVVGLMLVIALAVVGAVLPPVTGGISGPGRVVNWPVGVGATLLVASTFWWNAHSARRARSARRAMAEDRDLEGERVQPAGSALGDQGASTSGVAGLVCTGPRLVSTGLAHARRVLRLSAIDYDSCGRVLSVLLTRSTRVPLNELSWRTGLEDLGRPLTQLRDLGGILILRRRPRGITLHPEWRSDLGNALGVRVGEAVEGGSSETVPGGGAVSPPRAASFEEVTEGSRRRLRVTVPARVAREDPELKELLEEQIHLARQPYEDFMSQNRPGQPGKPSVEGVWAEHGRKPGGPAKQ